MTHWKTLWCWEGLGAGGEGDHRLDGREFESWWWTGRPAAAAAKSLQSCPTLCHLMDHSTPPNSQSLPKLMSIKSVMPSNHLILCRPLLLLPSIFPSIRIVSSESDLCIRWPKYWSFSFNISPSNEHPGLISFRMDWLDLLAVQGTLKSLLQRFWVQIFSLYHF